METHEVQCLQREANQWSSVLADQPLPDGRVTDVGMVRAVGLRIYCGRGRMRRNFVQTRC